MRRCTLLLLVILSAALHAQNVRGFAMSALPGIPFTGQETIIWTHQVSDKTVTTRVAGTVARDSQGRTYREVHRFTVDAVDPRTTLLRITLQARSQASPPTAISPHIVAGSLSSPQRRLLKRFLSPGRR